MLPIITAHTPAGTSTYTIIHYMQEYLSGKSFDLKKKKKDSIINRNKQIRGTSGWIGVPKSIWSSTDSQRPRPTT